MQRATPYCYGCRRCYRSLPVHPPPTQVAILIEDVACRVEAASPSELGRVQSRLAGGVVGALTRAGDVTALEAGGGHVVKVMRAVFFGDHLFRHFGAPFCLETFTQEGEERVRFFF